MQDLYLLKEIHEELGIQERHLADNKLASCEQPFYTTLEVVEIDYEGKAFVLNKPAAQAWRELRSGAKKDAIELKPFSGFRSYVVASFAWHDGLPQSRTGDNQNYVAKWQAA